MRLWDTSLAVKPRGSFINGPPCRRPIDDCHPIFAKACQTYRNQFGPISCHLCDWYLHTYVHRIIVLGFGRDLLNKELVSDNTPNQPHLLLILLCERQPRCLANSPLLSNPGEGWWGVGKTDREIERNNIYRLHVYVRKGGAYTPLAPWCGLG